MYVCNMHVRTLYTLSSGVGVRLTEGGYNRLHGNCMGREDTLQIYPKAAWKFLVPFSLFSISIVEKI